MINVEQPFMFAYSYLRMKYGISKKKIKSKQNNTFSYMERGTPSSKEPTLVIIHGFTSSKESFFGVFNNLPRKYHVIALDLPGHGETPLKDGNVGIKLFVDALNEVLFFVLFLFCF